MQNSLGQEGVKTSVPTNAVTGFGVKTAEQVSVEAMKTFDAGKVGVLNLERDSRLQNPAQIAECVQIGGIQRKVLYDLDFFVGDDGQDVFVQVVDILKILVKRPLGNARLVNDGID